MQTTENVAEAIRINVFEVEDLNIQVFMNYVSYVTWKNKQLEAKYKKENML